jgi:hypothetical protein
MRHVAHMGEMKMHTNFQSKKKDHFGHISVEGRTPVQCTLQEQDVKVWTELNRLRTMSCVTIW